MPQALRGFQKVELAPGQACEVTFTLTPRDLAHYDAALHGWYAAPGRYELRIGRSSRDIRQTLELRYETTRRPPLAIDENTPLGVLLADDRTAPVIRRAMAEHGVVEGDAGDGLMPPEAMAAMLDASPLRGMVQYRDEELAPLLAALREAAAQG